MNIKTVLTGFVLTLFVVVSAQAGDKKKVSPLAVEGAQTITVKQAKALHENGIVFIDVRSNKDWKADRIKDAKHIELKKGFNEKSLGSTVKKNQEFVIYCNGPSCLRSSKASIKAVGWGYSKVRYFREGIPAWKTAGLAVEK